MTATTGPSDSLGLTGGWGHDRASSSCAIAFSESCGAFPERPVNVKSRKGRPDSTVGRERSAERGTGTAADCGRSLNGKVMRFGGAGRPRELGSSRRAARAQNCAESGIAPTRGGWAGSAKRLSRKARTGNERVAPLFALTGRQSPGWPNPVGEPTGRPSFTPDHDSITLGTMNSPSLIPFPAAVIRRGRGAGAATPAVLVGDGWLTPKPTKR